MTTQPITNPAVASVFEEYPQPIQAKLLLLRQLIFDTAAKTTGVGQLEETLKWGQPSYLTPQTKSGSTIRIDQVKRQKDQIAIFFNCQTNLVEMFRDIYRYDLQFEDNRAILINIADDIPQGILGDCIAMALTYHLRKRG